MSKKERLDKKERMARKKAVVMGTGERSRFGFLMMALFGILFAAALTFTLWPTRGKAPAAANETLDRAVSGTPASETVVLPANLFDDGRARYYEYRNGEQTIRYFVLKSSDGVIRAAFDACDVCWPAGKGYYQDGDVMVCRNCGRRFASVLVNEVQGGCNPAPLKRRIEDGKVIITVKNLLEGSGYFNFSGKA